MRSRLTLTVENDVRARLDKEAASRGITLSQHVRDLIRRSFGVAPQESGYREGLIQGTAEAKKAIQEAIHGLMG